MKVFEKIIMSLLFIAGVCYCSSLVAQKRPSKTSPQRGPSDFEELITAPIPGAPVLSQPQLIMGSTAPVKAEGFGWASPAMMDWDGDGRKDLLVGEFASGSENKSSVGNFIRVYLNEGTDQQPKFSDLFKYAYGNYALGTGSPLSVYTWCCMAFTPRIVDLNNDGFDDIVTGQFDPGDVTWFKGAEDGFLAGEKLDQSAEHLKIVKRKSERTEDPLDITSHHYWMYSSVAFGDFDDDGDQDMIVGGSSLRLSENLGTKTDPVFGYRKRLLDIHEKPLRVFSDADSVPAKVDAGCYTAVPYVVDWDDDGTLDLLVTHAYVSPGDAAITFFKGRKTPKGFRFESGISLLSLKNKSKVFPGTNPNICVADWNNDGIHDIIVGVNVATLDGKFDPELSWGWEGATGTYKLNIADYDPNLIKIFDQQIQVAKAYQDSTGKTSEQLRKENRFVAEDLYKHYYVSEKYKKLSHKGYLYVLLGKKEN